MNKATKAKIKAQLEAITYEDLYRDATRPAGDRYQWREMNLEVIERDGLLIISGESGHSLVDYYGEFRGNYPYIDPRIEAIAEKHDCHWEWENPGAIALVEN